MYVFIFLVKVTEWPPIGKIAAHSAYEMFLWYTYLIVTLVFSHLGFWSGNLSLIAPFSDLCLLVPFFTDMFTYDKTFDRKVLLSHCDLISWFSDFALYLDTQLLFFFFILLSDYE